MDSLLREKFYFVMAITSQYNKLSWGGQRAIVKDLYNYEKILDLMSHEDQGPWPIVAKQAKEILRIERKKARNQYEFIFILILSLISAVAFFAGIFINQISLSYGSLFIPIGIAIFLNFFKKTS